MQWWLILLVGVVFGVVVIALAAFAARARILELQLALTTLDEHGRSAQRLGKRAEKVQVDIEQLQAKLPQPSELTLTTRHSTISLRSAVFWPYGVDEATVGGPCLPRIVIR